MRMGCAQIALFAVFAFLGGAASNLLLSGTVLAAPDGSKVLKADRIEANEIVISAKGTSRKISMVARKDIAGIWIEGHKSGRITGLSDSDVEGPCVFVTNNPIDKKTPGFDAALGLGTDGGFLQIVNDGKLRQIDR